MSYPYSQVNRLEEPHSYMYTRFQGGGFLDLYLSSRMAVINRLFPAEEAGEEFDALLFCSFSVIEEHIRSYSSAAAKNFSELTTGWGLHILRGASIADERLEQRGKDLTAFSINERINASELLSALIIVQLSGAGSDNEKVWLDRLVQRFEVTKKIYESYPSGFKKGEGLNTLVRLYWQFALSLCLYYTRTREIKFLSTLLKVCDLLCSLPENMLRGQIPEHGLPLVLAVEVNSILLLAEEKGVSLASR